MHKNASKKKPKKKVYVYNPKFSSIHYTPAINGLFDIQPLRSWYIRNDSKLN